MKIKMKRACSLKAGRWVYVFQAVKRWGRKNVKRFDIDKKVLTLCS
jgi:hypothetical protein